MKVFVTGGTGFVGEPTVKKLLETGHDVLLLVKDLRSAEKLFSGVSNIKFVRGSLENIGIWKKELKEFNPDSAIHLAWEGIPDYGKEMSQKNLKMGMELYNILIDAGCKKIITTGSCWEFGKRRGKLRPDDEVHPDNDFTNAKDSLRRFGMDLADEAKIVFIWARLYYVYGPRQKESSLIPYLINTAIGGKVPEVKTPYSKNDFVYVEDVGEALRMLLDKCGKSGLYNVGSGYSTMVQDIISIICKVSGLDYPTLDVPNFDDVEVVDFYADLSKIKKDVGWEPKVGIEEGVGRCIDLILKK